MKKVILGLVIAGVLSPVFTFAQSVEKPRSFTGGHRRCVEASNGTYCRPGGNLPTVTSTEAQIADIEAKLKVILALFAELVKNGGK